MVGMAKNPTPPVHPEDAGMPSAADDTAAIPPAEEPALSHADGPTEELSQAHPDEAALRTEASWASTDPAAAAAPTPASSPGLRDRIAGSWRQATSTRGGRIGVTIAAVVGTLALIGVIGMAALGAGHRMDRDGRGGWANDHGMSSQRDGMGRHQANDGGQGMGQGPGMGQGQGMGQGRGQGMGQGQGMGDGRHQANGGGQGLGQGQGQGMGRGGQLGSGGGMGGMAGMAMSAVLHGEFVTAILGTPTTMLVQTGTVSEVTAGKSLKVKSSDGFEATYVLSEQTAYPGGSTTLATGASVRVLAAKDGAKAIMVMTQTR